MKRLWLSLCCLIPAVSLLAADYYWVGNGGYWTDAAVHWATTPGGDVFHTEPPGTDDHVFFDEHSFTSAGQSVIINTSASCLDFDASAVTNQPYFENREDLNIYGSFTLSGQAEYYFNQLHFYSSSYWNLINTNGAHLGDNARLDFNGQGDGGWRLMDSLSFGDHLNFNSGYLDLNGFPVNAGTGSFNIGGDAGDTLNIAGARIYAQWFNANSSPEVITDGSSIFMTGRNNGGFNGANLTYDHLVILGYTEIGNDENSILDLELRPGAELVLPSGRYQSLMDLQVTGERNAPITISSDTAGTRAYLDVFTTDTIFGAYLLLRDISVSGPPAVIADSSVDLGNNTGWTITALTPAEYYWVGDGGKWTDLSHWSASSGGTPGKSFLPSRFDKVIFDEQSFSLSGQSVIIDTLVSCGDADFSGITQQPLVHMSGDQARWEIGGSLTLGTGGSYQLGQVYFVSLDSGNTLTTNSLYPGDASSFNFTGSGSWTLMDSLSVRDIWCNNGYLDLNGQAVYTGGNGAVYISGDSQVKINLENARIYTGRFTNHANSALPTAGSTIYLASPHGTSFSGNSAAYHDLVLDGSLNFEHEDLSFNRIELLPGSELVMAGGRTITAGEFIADGTRSLQINIRSDNQGTAATLDVPGGDVLVDFAILRDVEASGGIPFPATNTVDQGNNLNWDVSPPTPLNYYWIGGGGDWSDLSHWSSAPGGSPDMGELPGKPDSVFFDAHSFDVAGQTVRLDAKKVYIGNLDMEEIDEEMSLLMPDWDHNLYINGSMRLSSLTELYGRDIRFISDSAGNHIAYHQAKVTGAPTISFEGAGSYTLLDSVTCSGLNLCAGTLDLNNEPLVCHGDFSINSSGQPVALYMRGSDLYLHNRWWMDDEYLDLDAGSSTIHVENNMDFQSDNNNDTLVLHDLVIARNYHINFRTNSRFHSITASSGTNLVFEEGSTTWIGSLECTGTGNNRVNLSSSGEATASLIDEHDTSLVAYARISNMAAGGGAVFLAVESEDQGNNSGWTFAADQVPPVFLDGYPDAGDVHENYLTLAVRTDEGARVCYVLTEATATAPAVDEVMNQTGAGGADPFRSGSFDINNLGEPAGQEINGLEPGREYRLYLVAEDQAGTPNVQASVTALDVHTPSGVPPEWISGYPRVYRADDNRIVLELCMNEQSRVYAVALPGGSAAPGFREVRSGTGAGGIDPAAGNNCDLPGKQPRRMSLYGLRPDADYDIYLVARDHSGESNLQDSVVMLAAHTGPGTSPVWEQDYPVITDTYDRGAHMNLYLDEAAEVYYVVMPDGSAEPAPEEIRSGKGAGGTEPVYHSYTSNEHAGAWGHGFNEVLDAGTGYDMFLVAQDYSFPPYLQDSVVKLEFVTHADNQAPSYRDHPRIMQAQHDRLTASFRLNEKGRVYYVLIRDTVAGCDQAEVLAGTGPGGTPALASGTVSVDHWNKMTYLEIGGLTPETDYDLYCIAEDDYAMPNIQDEPYKLDAATTRGPLDYYWVGDGGYWSDTSHWATESGGTVHHSEPPGKNDRVIFDDRSFSAYGQEINTGQRVYCHSLDMSDVLYHPVLKIHHDMHLYGDLVIPGTAGYELNNLHLETFDTSLIAISGGEQSPDYLDNLNLQGQGRYILPHACRINHIYFRSGLLEINDSVSVGNFETRHHDGDSYVMRHLRINAPGISIDDLNNNSGTGSLDIEAPNTVFYLSNLRGEGLDLPYVRMEDNSNLWGNNSIDTLELAPGTELRMQGNSRQEVKHLMVQGQKNRPVAISSEYPGVPARFVVGADTVHGAYLMLSDNHASGGAVFLADQSVDGGNNSGWQITGTVYRDYYWVGGSGNWSDLSHWSTTPGGPADHAAVPGRFERVIFDQHSFDEAGRVSLDMEAEMRSLDLTGVDKPVSVYELTGSPMHIYGSLLLPEQINWHVTRVFFHSDSAGNIIQNGHCLGETHIELSGGGSYTLADSGHFSHLTMNGGSLSLNGQSLLISHDVTIQSDAPKTLDLGHSNLWVGDRWQVRTTPIEFDAGTSTIYLDNGDFHAGRSELGVLTYHNVVFGNVNLHDDAFFSSITLMPGQDLNVQAGDTYSFNELNATGSMNNPINLRSTNHGHQFTFSKGSGTVTASWLNIQDALATGGAAFNALESQDLGNNSGWTFLADTAVPVFSDGYPQVAGANEHTADLALLLDEGCTVYYVLTHDTASVPSVDQVKSGTGAPGSGVLHHGTINIDNPLYVTYYQLWDLSPETAYRLFLVAEDQSAARNLQTAVTSLTVLTGGNEPPEFESGYPLITNFSESCLEFRVRVNEPSRICYGILPAGDPAPLPHELRAGAGDFVQYSSCEHHQPEETRRETVTGLAAGTAYDLYVVASDLTREQNLQDSVTRLGFTTTANEAPVFLSGSPRFDWAHDDEIQLQVSVNEPCRLYYVVLPDSAEAPSVQQVIDGQEAGGAAALNAGMERYDAYGDWWHVSVSKGLAPETSYDIYAVAEDLAIPANRQSSPSLVNVATDYDRYQPEIIDGPHIASRTDSSLRVYLAMNEPGTVYYVVDGPDADQPSAEQVFMGLNAADGSPILNGTFAAEEGYTGTMDEITGLSRETAYRIFLAIEDTAPDPNRNGGVWQMDGTTGRGSEDYYWVGDGGDWSDTQHWATSSGGSTFHAEPPGAEDNVYFDTNSFSKIGQTVSVNQEAWFRDMIWTGMAYNTKFEANNRLHAGGSVIIPSVIRIGIHDDLYLSSADSGKILGIDFSSYTNDYINQIVMQAHGSYTVTDSADIRRFWHDYGHLAFRAPFSIHDFETNNNQTGKSITLDSTVLYVNSWRNHGGSNLVLNSVNSRMVISGDIHDWDRMDYPVKMVFRGEVYCNLDSGIDTLVIEKGSTCTIEQGRMITVGELLAKGTRDSVIEIRSGRRGISTLLKKTSGTVEAEWLKISDNTATGGATFNAHNSFDLGNTSGWAFTQAELHDYYWIGGTGNWSDLSNWSRSSGGVSDHIRLPSEFENVYFDSASFTAEGQSVMLDREHISVNSFDMSGSLYQPTITGNYGLNIHGSLILHDEVTWEVRQVDFLSDKAGNAISEAGASNRQASFNFYGDGEWVFTDSAALNGIDHRSGTLDFGGQALRVYELYSQDHNTRVLRLDSSYICVGNQWNINGDHLVIDPGTSTLVLENADFRANADHMPGIAYHDVVVSSFAHIRNNTSFNSLKISPGATLVLEEGSTFSVGELQAAGTESERITISSDNTGHQAFLNQPDGTVNASYLDLYDNAATGGAVFNAFFATGSNISGWNLVKKEQVVSFDTGNHPVFDSTGIALAAEASSGLEVAYALESGDGSIEGNMLYPEKADTFLVSAWQPGDDWYHPADTAQQVYYVLKMPQSIDIDSIPDKKIDDPPFVISATASSGLPLSFTAVGPATLTGDTLTLGGESGMVTLHANQPGNDIWAPAEASFSFNVEDTAKLDQAIIFDTIFDHTFGDEYVVVSARSGSGLPVSFSIASGNASVSNDTVFLPGAGDVSVTASQEGSETYNPAQPVTRSFTVHKAPQSITMTQVQELLVGRGQPLMATATSGLQVSFRVSAGEASISNDTLFALSTGTVVVSAFQGGNSNYLEADSISMEVTVISGEQHILFQEFEDVDFTHPPVELTTRASSGLPLSFSLRGPAILSNDSIFFTSESGVVTLVAFQEGNDNYLPVTDSVSFSVSDPAKKSQSVIDFDSIPDVRYLETELVVVSAATSSGLPVQFHVVNGPATMSHDTAFITGGGLITLSASHPGNDTLNPAPAVQRTFRALKALQSIDFTPVPELTYGDPPQLLEAVSSAGLPVSFSVTGRVSLAYDTLKILGAGEASVTASQPGNNDYEAVSATRYLSIRKAAQVLDMQGFPDVETGDGPIALTTTVSSGLPLLITVEGPATISPSSIHLDGGTGYVRVHVSQGGNADYLPVSDSAQFIVSEASKSEQSISFDPVADQTFDVGSLVLTATAGSGLEVEYAVVAGPASVSEDTLFVLGLGTISVAALQAGDESYNPADPVIRSFSVSKGHQHIDFSAIPVLTVGETYLPRASASSGLPVAFRVTNGDAAFVNDSILATGSGLATLTAYQQGNELFLEADSVNNTFLIEKGSQEIIFPVFENRTVRDDPFPLNTHATSGLPLLFSVRGPASLKGDTLWLSGGTGQVTVIAEQQGNDDYLPVVDSAWFIVTDPFKINQAITFSEIPDIPVGRDSLVLSAGASSGLPVHFTLSGQGTLAGNVVYFSGLGTIRVTAHQLGNELYNPAEEVVRIFDVVENPVCPDPLDFADTAICENDTLRLERPGWFDHDYHWLAEGTGDTVSATNLFKVLPREPAGYVYVERIISTGCEERDTFRVSLLSRPVISYRFRDGINEIFPDSAAVIELEGAEDYQFDPAGSVSTVEEGALYQLAPERNTSYRVTGVSAEGCYSVPLAAEVFVFCGDCGDELVFPSAGLVNHGCTDRNYANNSVCSWTLFPNGVPEIELRINLDSFDIRAGDFLHIYDGRDADPNTLIGSFNNDNLPDTSYRGGSEMYLSFTSNGSGTGRGFQIRYGSPGSFVGNISGPDERLKVYPNPSRGTFVLEIKQATFRKAEAGIFSSLGQKIWNRELVPVNGSVYETIELRSVPDGIYYMRVISGGEIWYKTLVIE